MNMWNAVDRLLEQGLREQLYPGCALAVGQKEKVLYRKTCGTLHPEGGAAVTEKSLYDVGALTQVMVTTPLCLFALENGLLSPDDTIDLFLQNVPQDKKGITIAQLLTQTSGLSPYFLLQEEARSQGDALSALLRHPLAGQVGGRVSDSGMGFLLLGFLLEKVFDMPLDDAAEKFVTNPLGMKRTCYLPSDANVAPTGFRDESGVLQTGYPMEGNARYLHGVAGNAGLFTCLEDAIRFAAMLSQNGRSEKGIFLSKRAVHLAVTERTRGMNAARGYGFHITKRSNPFLGLLWPSDGYGLRDEAMGSVLAVSPEDGLYAVLLVNGQEEGMAKGRMERFTRLLLGAAYAAFQHEE